MTTSYFKNAYSEKIYVVTDVLTDSDETETQLELEANGQMVEVWLTEKDRLRLISALEGNREFDE